MSTITPPRATGSAGNDDVRRYVDAQSALDATLTEVTELESSESVEAFHTQLDLLKRRLIADPRAFREVFIADGMQAIAWEFGQPELSKEFTERLWDLMLRDDDASRTLMRFVWNLPLGKKRLFIRAIDKHLSYRYPMFDGYSTDWPAQSSIPPYIREPEDRSADFGLVNQGYLGYMNLGFTARDIDMFVWLEALRDKQCAEKPCELGEFLGAHKAPKGGCPVKIHIPQVFELVGQGRFEEALELLESCNPLPDVTGRVCPQELQCQGVCLHKTPMSIGQVEWFLPQREMLVHPGSKAIRFGGRTNP